MAGPAKRALSFFKKTRPNIILPNYNLKKYVEDTGYPFEIHKDIKTEDGYLLTMFRVPHGRGNSAPPENKTPAPGESQSLPPQNSKPAILLMHGLGCAGDSWLISGPNHSLALLLADKGYDVWIGNARGTSHSQKHSLFDPTKNPKQFWNFSTHEIGRYDLYAKIDYIVKTTGQDKIYFVGHSQGCTHFFVMASTKPVINRNVKMMFALAPTVYQNTKYIRPIKNERIAFLILRLIDIARRVTGLHTNILGRNLKYLFCESTIATSVTCDMYFSQIKPFLKFDFKKTQPEHATVMKHLIPETISSKQILHNFQTRLTGNFREYHYGLIQNFWKYEMKYPPVYKFNRIDIPVVLFMGEKDQAAPRKLVERLAKNLPIVVAMQEIKAFQHGDFLSADAAASEVYSKIFDILAKVEKK